MLAILMSRLGLKASLLGYWTVEVLAFPIYILSNFRRRILSFETAVFLKIGQERTKLEEEIILTRPISSEKFPDKRWVAGRASRMSTTLAVRFNDSFFYSNRENGPDPEFQAPTMSSSSTWTTTSCNRLPCCVSRGNSPTRVRTIADPSR